MHRPRRSLATVATLVASVLLAGFGARLPVAAAATYPHVTINSPANGATVKGVVTVDATGSTDPSGTDAPSQLQLIVDGSAIGSYACDGTSTTCHGSQTWDSTTTSGSHTITVEADTMQGASAA